MNFIKLYFDEINIEISASDGRFTSEVRRFQTGWSESLECGL